MWIIQIIILLVGCSLATAVDNADQKLDEYNQREAELKQQLAKNKEYVNCWLRQYNLCVTHVFDNIDLCNYAETRQQLTECERTAQKECTNDSN